MLRKALLVGVGGSGGQTIRHAFRELTSRLEGVGWTGSMPTGWQFLHIDVPEQPDGFGHDDAVALNDRLSYVGLASAPLEYGAYESSLTRNAAAIPALSGWLPDARAPHAPPHRGAGQQRTVGRVVALARIDRAFNALRRSLEALNSQEATSQLTALTQHLGVASNADDVPRAFVVTSLAGGTGSAIFLDVVQLLRSRATSSAKWLDQLVTILYAPDVFDFLPEALTTGVKANSFAAMCELIAAHDHTGVIDSNEEQILAYPAAVAPLHGSLAAPYNFIIGRGNGSMSLPDSEAVIQLTGNALTALVINAQVQSAFGPLILGNWAGPPLKSTIGDSRRSRHACSTFGFSRIDLGRRLLGRYMAERLAKYAVIRLLYGHREGANDPSPRALDEVLIARLVDSQQAAFLDRCQLLESDSSDGKFLKTLRDLATTTRALDDLGRVVLGAIDASAINGTPSEMAEIVDREFDIHARTIGRRLADDYIDRSAIWVDAVQANVLDATANYAARFGLPVSIELNRRVEYAMEAASTELQRASAISLEREGRLLAAAHQIFANLRARRIGSGHESIARAVEIRRDALRASLEARLFALASSLLSDLARGLLLALRDVLTRAHASLHEGRMTQWRELVDHWSVDRVPRHLEPAPSDVLLEEPETCQEQFDALVCAVFDTKNVMTARASAIGEVITGAWPDIIFEVAGPQNLIAQLARWGPDTETVRRSDQATSTAHFGLAIDPPAILERATVWVQQRAGPCSDYIRGTLANYLDQTGPDASLRVDRFVEAFSRALGNAAPLGKINGRILDKLHDGYGSIRYTVLTGKIPLGPSHPAYKRVLDILQRGAEGQDVQQLFDSAHICSEIDIFTFVKGSAHPAAFDALVTPIARDWERRRLNEGERAAFWRDRRARPLRSFVPTSPGHQLALIRGYWTARLLGMLPPLEGTWSGRPLSIWSPAGSLTFPPFLLGPEADDPSLLPALMESLGLAFVSLTLNRDGELAAYERLIELGTDLSSWDADLLRYDAPNPELALWVTSGKTQRSQQGSEPAPDPRIAGQAAGTPDERRQAISSSIASVRAWLQRATEVERSADTRQITRISGVSKLCDEAMTQLAGAMAQATTHPSSESVRHAHAEALHPPSDMRSLIRQSIVEGRFSDGERLLRASTGAQELWAEFGFLLDQRPAVPRLSMLWHALGDDAGTPVREHGVDLGLPSSQSVPEIAPLADTAAGTGHSESLPASPFLVPGLGEPSDAVGPQAIGASFELGMESLLKRLFISTSSISAEKVRRQRAGVQFGHDLELDITILGTTVKCRFECKNQGDAITPTQVLAKLIVEEREWHTTRIDHWILVSPRSSPGNDFNQTIQDWNRERRYPFTVQMWTRDEGVEELLSLDPDLFLSIYELPAPALTATEAADIRARWVSRLAAPMRIPDRWIQYLRNPSWLCARSEERLPDQLAEAFEHPLLLRAIGASGRDVSLDSILGEWLAAEDQKCFLLLGEFGEGKTYATYALARMLAQDFLASPKHGWVPVRLPLRDLIREPDARRLLDRRLSEWGGHVWEWAELESHHNTLLILDGFDEMSSKIDTASLTANLDTLEQCIQEFGGKKVLVTSRPLFGRLRHGWERVTEILRDPLVARLSHPDREDIRAGLEDYAAQAGVSEAFERIRTVYDAIGLATKPLFFHMVKATLAKLPEGDLDEIGLYDTYIEESLRRKIEQLRPPVAALTPNTELVSNLRSILAKLAIEMLRSGKNYVCLIDTVTDVLADVLWNVATENTDLLEDAQARVEVRSLLVPVSLSAGDADEARRPVDFFNRSLREYFIAQGLLAALQQDRDQATSLLASGPLTAEVLHFTVEMLRRPSNRTASEVLLGIARGSTIDDGHAGTSGGNALSLLCSASSGRLPSDDWSNLNLDYVNLARADLSDMSFRGSSLQYANLDNADLTRADLRNANLRGARLEETALVLSMTVLDDDPAVVAGYSDGSVRSWRRLPNREWHATHVRIRSDNEIYLVASIAGRLIIHSSEGVEVVDPTRDWEQVCLFACRPDLEAATLGSDGDLIAQFAASSGGSDVMTVSLASVPIRPLFFSPAAPGPTIRVTEGVYVLPWSAGSVVLASVDDAGVWTALQDFGPVSAAAVGVVRDGRVVLGAGYPNGRVSVYELSLNDGVSCIQLAQEQVHDGRVSTIAVGGHNVVASGSYRTIRLMQVRSDQTAIPVESQELRIVMRCGGIQLDGLMGERERLALEEMRSRSESDGTTR